MLDPMPSSASSVTACRRVYKKLRLGKYELQGSLDLHHKTLNEARIALVQFIAECEVRDIRCLLILHGKGSAAPACPAQEPCQRLAATVAFGDGHAAPSAATAAAVRSTYCCARASARRRKTANGTRSASADCLRVAPGGWQC